MEQLKALRVLAAWIANPHLKDKQTPAQMLPLPGDNSREEFAQDLSKKLHEMSDEELNEYMSK